MSKILDFLEFVVNAILYGAFMIVIGVGFIVFFAFLVVFDFIWGLIEKLYKRLFK